MKHFLISTVCLFVSVLFVSGCGTATKTQTSGDIEVWQPEAAKPLVPLLLQYKFEVASGRHEFFFWDENHNRFNAEIPEGTDTAKGVIVYLPAGREYAFSGFLKVSVGGNVEYPFGENLNVFKLKPGVVNALPYFVVSKSGGHVQVRQERGIHLKDARQKFANLKDVRQIDVKLTDGAKPKSVRE